MTRESIRLAVKKALATVTSPASATDLADAIADALGID